ncbi:MAG: hypothetical protein AAFY78_25040, partial [Cyanobacteria bacterium J06648_16]
MISAPTPPNAVTASPAPESYPTYKARLHPWCIVRLLPKCQRIVVGRFRKRNDAEDHRRTLRQLMPQAQFIVLFDAPKIAKATSEPVRD